MSVYRQKDLVDEPKVRGTRPWILRKLRGILCTLGFHYGTVYLLDDNSGELCHCDWCNRHEVKDKT